MSSSEVLVVGAGLAGLRCAGGLRARGVSVRIFEAASVPGGRVNTEVIDGFRCDRGFQLLNPSYPALQRHVNVGELDLRQFGRGVRVVDTDGTIHTLADPLAHPGHIASTVSALIGRYARPRSAVGAVRWALPAVGKVSALESHRDRAMSDDWSRLGVDGPLRDDLLAPFLSGVLGDDGGQTSDRYVRLVLRSFLRGTPGVPALGMAALPAQLATGIDITYNSTVESVTGTSVTLAGGKTIPARAVVVATDPPTADSLTGIGTAGMRGLSTWWFAADDAPAEKFLRVPAKGGPSPLVNTANMSATAPRYAPPGRTLVQATTLLRGDGPAQEKDVRAHLSTLWNASASSWDLLTRHDVVHALPIQAPGMATRRTQRVGPSLFVAGDHRDTPSIQGALASGTRAAGAVARLLAG